MLPVGPAGNAADMGYHNVRSLPDGGKQIGVRRTPTEWNGTPKEKEKGLFPKAPLLKNEHTGR